MKTAEFESVLSAQGVHKSNKSSYGDGVDILKGIELSIRSAETVAIVGASGSGKTTLLSLLAGLDVPDSGVIQVMNQSLAAMTESALTRFRAQHLGIVFQHFYLMQHFNALENICLPLEILNQDSQQVKQRGLEYLERVGLSDRAEHMPVELSGGEIQRIAIARALIAQPKILFADEPTGNLDSDNANNIAQLLFDLVNQQGMTLVLVTHNLRLADQCQRIYEISHGQLKCLK